MKYLILLASLLCLNTTVSAFCGFYVAKADAKLFNESSQVIMVRDGSHTVITMSNDFQGAVSDFAMVIPVPEVLQESDIRVSQQYIFDKLDAYTAPRMVEYFDRSPCQRIKPRVYPSKSVRSFQSAPEMDEELSDAKDMGVTIEASYTVGEYDILILSAKESGGLKKWLIGNGYKLPKNAEEALDPYVQDGMKFFVVKVNLEAQKMAGFTNLRPLQIQFNSDRFMLPIRLGMANAKSTQDMILYTFTRNGRVETANYRTTKLPTDREIPVFVKTQNKFGEFYKAVYDKAWANEGKNSVMLEYAWNVSGSNPVKCDPCNTPAITFAELREAGVWWLQAGNMGNYTGELFVTRLHVRYGRKTFPQDLVFLNTPNGENFQGRYIVRHPATGDLSCSEGRKYLKNLALRKKKELDELAALTGWSTSKYSWYLGDAQAPQPVETDPVPVTPTLEDPLRNLPSTLGNVGGSPASTVVEVAPKKQHPPVSAVAAQDTEIGTRVRDENLLRSSEDFVQQARLEASASGTSNWWLFGLAGGMFLAGMLFRKSLGKSKES